MAFFVSIFSAFCFLIDVIIHNYILGIYIYIYVNGSILRRKREEIKNKYNIIGPKS